MLTIEALEQAVEQLPPADFARFRRWFEQFESDGWDAQIEADAAAGRLDKLAEEALADYRNGHAREL